MVIFSNIQRIVVFILLFVSYNFLLHVEVTVTMNDTLLCRSHFVSYIFFRRVVVVQLVCLSCWRCI